MRSPVVVAALAVAGCNDAVVLEIGGDRPVPTAIDAICVGVTDSELAARPFGQHYRLEGDLARLPQTLRLEPGGADAAYAWVRADRAGVPVAAAAALVDFSRDVTLALDRCVRGPAGGPSAIGGAVGPAGARLVPSRGAGGVVVLALAGDPGPIVLDARSGALVAADAPALAGALRDAIAADLDGDCDDDLVIAVDGAAPALWRRDGRELTDAGTLGGDPIAAVAAADVDRDGDVDLVTGSGAALSLWRNDGGGNFTLDAAALSGGGRVADVRALALGDLDGDGAPDLVVGQGGEPLRAWLGEPAGTGSFLPADAVVPPVPLDVVRLALVDADGDFDPDLVVIVRGAPARLYIDCQGRLEDQLFVRFPQPAPAASALAIGGWDDGCEPDALLAAASGAAALRGTPTMTFAPDAELAPASDAVFADLDDDGDLDALLAGPEGVTWLAR